MEDKKDNYEGFVYITQGGIGRITEETPANIQGLYTDGLSSCVGVLMISQDRKRKVLIHYDGGNPDDVFHECNWIGDNGICFVVRNKEQQRIVFMDALISYGILGYICRKFQDNISFIQVEGYNEGNKRLGGTVGFSRNVTRIEDLLTMPNLNRSSSIVFQYSDLRWLNNFSNAYDCTFRNLLVPHNLDLQFNGVSWTRMPRITDSYSPTIYQNEFKEAKRIYDEDQRKSLRPKVCYKKKNRRR